ncbi:kinase-like domain-containing protein [Fomitopsis serialis]|uniref:kinase-like domain-containing protein n=1 Tax=Fomitopsis serialis TaxID=139415 RepID=UPI0020081D7F|nr:kinase-like domain-containing protein [Neoantrodia serialis]KAH9920914.1 kinase-like domain-containing protein [Neoantrodia serialis]
MDVVDSSPASRPTADEQCSTLYPHELAWRDRQPFLESHGYMLRPRLRPGWVPSWRVSGDNPWFCEDSHSLRMFPHIVDATRMSDGKLVSIKLVRTGSLEMRIALYLCTPPLCEDIKNHCVPLLDLFEDNKDASRSYMVTPFLRDFDDPLFDCVNDVLDLGEQYLEGLVFLHRSGVAHRDCTNANMMMDAGPLYPRGFHPLLGEFLPDGKTGTWPNSRTRCPVKYYFIDFGISRYFPPDVQSKLVIGGDGRDQEPPELSDDIPYDPFKLDVFILGNFLRKNFYDRFSNVEFMRPIWEAMTRANPDERPSAADALQQWQRMRKAVSYCHRSWRLKRREESRGWTLFLGLVHVIMVVHCAVTRSKCHVAFCLVMYNRRQGDVLWLRSCRYSAFPGDVAHHGAFHELNIFQSQTTCCARHRAI